MNPVPLADAVVAAHDPRRQREPIVLGHFPLPHLYRMAESAADKAGLGAVPLTAVTVYYTHCYGSSFMHHWTRSVGIELYYLTVGKVAMSLARDIQDIEAKKLDLHRELVPLPSLFIAKLFQTVLSYRDPRMVTTACEAFAKYCELVEPYPDLKGMAQALKEPIALLEECKTTFSVEAVRNYNRLLQYALSQHALTIGNMVAAIDAFGKDVAKIVVRRTEERPEHPFGVCSEEEVMVEPVQESAPEAQEPSYEELEDHYVPTQVEHLDGSVGYSAHRDLAAIYEPQSPQLEDAEQQLQQTLQLHQDEPYASALQLWWKLRSSKGKPKKALAQAWVLEATARFLKAMFTPAQFATMGQHLAIQEVVDWTLNFICDTESDIPILSWPQLRISAISFPICRMAYLANANGVDLAVKMYEAMGLLDEISLLRVTLDVQSEGMAEVMERQSRESKLSTRH
jgi:hypothetical protein